MNAIRQHAGHETVIAAIAELRRFPPAYQEAAARAGLPRLREETVASVNRLWR